MGAKVTVPYFCQPSNDSLEESTSVSPSSNDSKSAKDKFINNDLADYRWTCEDDDDDDEQLKICKVVVLGEQCRFKTQFVSMYSEQVVSVHLEIKKQVHSLQVWDVPDNVFSLQNQTMANIYCQHSSAAILLIDATDLEALSDAEERISTLKRNNERISIMMLATRWACEERVYSEEQIDLFCKRVHSFLSWRKVSTVAEDEQLRHESMIALDASVKHMITAGIRHGKRLFTL